MAISDKKKKPTISKISEKFGNITSKASIDKVNAENAKIIAKKRAETAAKKRAAAAKKRLGTKTTSGAAILSGVAGTAKPRAKGAASLAGIYAGQKKGTKTITKHTVVSGDTLSAITKKYYGSATKPYWDLIQKANSDIIKDANLIYPGQVFNIPELPAELKKK